MNVYAPVLKRLQREGDVCRVMCKGKKGREGDWEKRDGEGGGGKGNSPGVPHCSQIRPTETTCILKKRSLSSHKCSDLHNLISVLFSCCHSHLSIYLSSSVSLSSQRRCRLLFCTYNHLCAPVVRWQRGLGREGEYTGRKTWEERMGRV